MSTREPSFGETTGSWEMREVPGESLHLSNVSADDVELGDEERRRSVREVREIAETALVAMRLDGDLFEISRIVLSEAVTNSIMHGKRLSRLGIVYEPIAETVEIVTANPVRMDQVPPNAGQTGRYVARIGNKNAEHGRGLDIIDKITHHWWEQRISEQEDGTHELVTLAIIRSGLAPLSFEDVA